MDSSRWRNTCWDSCKSSVSRCTCAFCLEMVCWRFYNHHNTTNINNCLKVGRERRVFSNFVLGLRCFQLRFKNFNCVVLLRRRLKKDQKLWGTDVLRMPSVLKWCSGTCLSFKAVIKPWMTLSLFSVFSLYWTIWPFKVANSAFKLATVSSWVWKRSK